MSMFEGPGRPLVGAVISPTGVKGVIFEDGVSARTREEAAKDVLRVGDEMSRSGGMTLRSAEVLHAAKASIDQAIQPIVARYYMCVLLERDPTARETVVSDLLNTTFRASAISILNTASKIMLNKDKHDDQSLFEKVDGLKLELTQKSRDSEQVKKLKAPDAINTVREAVELILDEMAHASEDAYTTEGIFFAEPDLIERTCQVYLDCSRRLLLS